MSNKHILIFSVAYLPFIGGAEIAVKEITDRLPDYGFEMITLNLAGRQKPQEQIGRILVHRVGNGGNGPFGYFHKLLYPFMAVRLARKLHAKRHFDATWSIMASFSGFAALFFKWRYPDVPFILTLQEGDPLNRPKRRAAIVWPLFVAIFRRADNIQTISSYLADFARSMGVTAPITVIPNGVDLAAFGAVQKLPHSSAYSHPSTTLITISRLVEKNGVGDIIDAMALLPASTRLIIVGTGALEASLKQKASKNNKIAGSERIYFAGFVPYAELPTWLAKADIFIRPSLSEGMGNAFIEAMAAGVPVIGTPVGGIVDFLRDGETGIFCQPHNPPSIAAAVKRLIDVPALRQKVIENGKKLAASYDWHSIAQRMNTEILSTPMA